MKAVLFDLDGTLLDTLEDLSNSVNYALLHHGFPQRSSKEIRSFLGNGARNLIRFSLPQGKEKSEESVFYSFLKHYALHSRDFTRPYPGIPQLLDSLQEKGVKVAIVSNKYDSAVQKLKEIYFPRADFAVGEQDGIARKPAPDSVFAAMKLFDATPEECVYVGDSEVDIQTAKNAGIPCVTVSWGFRDREDLEKAGATHFADTREDLARILDELLGLN